jgi:putative sulfotransferase
LTADGFGRAFVICNGRCGSTLLSELIAREPGTLSVQEFNTAVRSPDLRSDQELTGEEYWAALSAPSIPMRALITAGVSWPEFRYPPTGRWARRLSVLPGILATTLPAISAEPDQLFDALAPRVVGFPTQTLARQHLMFLDLLAALARRRRWVERSGGSSLDAPFLLREYPTAKFIYLTRGLAANAASMSKHPVYQLFDVVIEFESVCGFNPYRAEARPNGPIPEHLPRCLPEHLTADALAERGANYDRFRYVSAFMTGIAEQALADMPPKELLLLRYEDLTGDPVGQLARVGGFLEFEDPCGWATATAHLVKAPR